MNFAQLVRTRLNRSYMLSDSPAAKWLRGAGWLFLSSLVERAVGLVQTIMIARALGIEDYGRYALLFSTIGLLGPVVGLQLPFALVYFVSRYQKSEPERAGAVVLLGRRLTATTTGLVLILTVVLSRQLSHWLFNSENYGLTVILGALLVTISVQAGLGDSILQAGERFRTLSLARLTAAILSIIVLIPVTVLKPGLATILAIVAGAGLYRALAVGIPARAISTPLVSHTDLKQALRQLPLIFEFALPSGLLALAQGIGAWVGNYYLSRSSPGLRDLAIVNTGLQWRTPIIVIMASFASALLPMLARYISEDNRAQTFRLHRYNVMLNVGIALGFCFLVILCSNMILDLYGRDFKGQWYLFSLFLISLIPMAYCTVHQQYLVASGKMWTQALLFVPYFVIVVAGTVGCPQLTGNILGYIQLIAWLSTAVLTGIVVAVDQRAQTSHFTD